MRTIIYTRALEPITVVWLAQWAVHMLSECGRINFAIHPPVATSNIEDAVAPIGADWVVRLRGEQLRLGAARTWILIADDEELALMLSAAFMPGQQGAVREHERQARQQGRDEGARFAFNIIRQLGDL